MDKDTCVWYGGLQSIGYLDTGDCHTATPGARSRSRWVGGEDAAKFPLLAAIACASDRGVLSSSL
eukprot:1586227-Rhodomonas_salina.1